MERSDSLSHEKESRLRRWLEEAIMASDAGLAQSPCEPSGDGAATAPSPPAETNPDLTNDHKRKLVTVRRIASLAPVNQKHSVATVDGWKVVVQNDRGFVEGNLVVFFEVDSFVPARSKFDALFADTAGPLVSFDNEEGYRVGSQTWTDWRKNEIISQGHIFHLADFPHIEKKVRDLRMERSRTHTDTQFADFIRGVDFSDALGVKKWESAAAAAATARESPGSRPGDGGIADDNLKGSEAAPAAPTAHPKPPAFVRKTDMERVQNCPNLFTKAKYRHFVFQESLKMDGATTTVYFVRRDSPYFASLPPLPSPPAAAAAYEATFLRHAVHPDGRFGVCSRNRDLLPHLLLPPPPSSSSDPAQVHAHANTHTLALYWQAAIDAGLHRTLPALGRSVAVQAELVGPAIQGNPYGYRPGRDAHELFVFAAVDVDGAPPSSSSSPSSPPPRWHPRKVEALAARLGLRHVPVLGYGTIWSVARCHRDLLDRAELKRGEGLVFKSCDDGRWFKVLSNRWILEKGDEALAARERTSGGEGEEKGEGEAEEKDKEEGGEGKEETGEQKVEDRMGGWQAGRDLVEELKRIAQNAEACARQDDQLQKWTEEWKSGWFADRYRVIAAEPKPEAVGNAIIRSPFQCRGDCSGRPGGRPRAGNGSQQKAGGEKVRRAGCCCSHC